MEKSFLSNKCPPSGLEIRLLSETAFPFLYNTQLFMFYGEKDELHILKSSTEHDSETLNTAKKAYYTFLVF
jgi:hypothetical protein